MDGGYSLVTISCICLWRVYNVYFLDILCLLKENDLDLFGKVFLAVWIIIILRVFFENVNQWFGQDQNLLVPTKEMWANVYVD